MAKPSSEYIIQDAHNTVCHACGKYVKLVCRENGNMRSPAFYICFNCAIVSRIGHGEVREVK